MDKCLSSSIAVKSGDVVKKGIQGELCRPSMRLACDFMNSVTRRGWRARESFRGASYYNESAGLFFLSLQGDKYGYRPLSCSLGRAAMETALAGAGERSGRWPRTGTSRTRTAQGESMCSRAWRRGLLG